MASAIFSVANQKPLSGYLAKCCAVLLLLAPQAYASEGGELDAVFSAGFFNGSVDSIIVQADGKLVLGGSFTSVNLTPRNYIARLTDVGALNTAFNPGANGAIKSLSIQTDSRILVGGAFSTMGGVAHNNIARLNSEGQLDGTFGTSLNASMRAAAVQADSKLVLGGDFTAVNGVTHNYIARLNSTGQLDSAFNTSLNSFVRAVSVQADGKLIIAGDFTTINGVPRGYCIARLNADGSLDTSFDPGVGTNAWVSAVAIQADGKVLIGGNFTAYNGATRNYITRLNSNGTLDTSFDVGTGANNTVQAILIQADGKVVIGGSFTAVNGVTNNYIARLNSDGSLDSDFNSSVIVNCSVSAITTHTMGQLLIGGTFSNVNGQNRYRIARIHTGDTDNDGIENAGDAFPFNVAASLDTDADGFPNSWNVACDETCQNNAGLSLDNCPGNANADQLNTDGDAQGNVCDTDDDNDGVIDGSDRFPLNAAESLDTDSDGTGNNADTDDDNDGALDVTDNCSLISNPDQLNTDGDAQGNACDTDDDNDGVLDTSDKFPLNAAAAIDGDNDGSPLDWNAACDTTCRANSGLVLDNCPWNANADQLNTDGDAAGNVCDTDDDNDGVPDVSDAYSLNPLYSADTDKDTLPDNWEVARGRNPNKADYAVSTNATHACAIDDTGVKCWGGNNSSGQLNTPNTLQNPYAITTGNTWSCACDDNGSTCWGSGYPATPACGVSTVGVQASFSINQPSWICNGGFRVPRGYSVQTACSINGSRDVICDTSGTNETYPLVSVEAFYTCHWTNYTINGEDKLFTSGSTQQLSQSGLRLCMLNDKGIQCNVLAATSPWGNTSIGVSATDFTAASLFIDSDNDGVSRPLDTNDLDASSSGDVDGDGVDSNWDNCPLNANANQLNTDGDAQGNVCDTDDDNDGVLDVSDAFPLNASESLDTDHDGIGNNADLDIDGDGIPNYIDADPLNAAINTERHLPLDNGYRGSLLQEQGTSQ